ncbi:AraC family transcriptional regulator [Microbacterium gilvum]|uniref:Helix-turn-helix domain-containing protein n=1 Tax=Microbacterium gilvum TaxID=1336204 RepID=A0ABP8ZX78_9MICO
MTEIVPYPVGITFAATAGTRTVYRFSGAEGLRALSLWFAMSSPDVDAFAGRLVSVPLQDYAYEDFSASAFVCERTPAHILAAPSDLVRITYVVEGTVFVDAAQRSTRVDPGQILAVNLRTPFRFWTEGPTRLATTSIPIRDLRLPPEQLEAVEFTVLERSPVIATWGAVMRALSNAAPDDGTRESELVAHALLDLAQAILSAPVGATRTFRADDALRQRVYDLIEREYADPDLQVSDIARRLRVSTRYVHRLFQDEPLSVARAIRSRRVEAAARAMLLTRRSFEEIAIAVGFGSVDSAHRAFREQIGLTPSAYRRSGGEAEPPG